MIKVFYGDDRVRMMTETKRVLGNNYEVAEGVDLETKDLPSLFLGNSLFDEKRKIVIRDLLKNKVVADRIIDYLNTPHMVVILENKITKNSVFYKSLHKNIEFREFKLPEINTYSQAKNIYNVAKRDGKKAVEMLEKIKLGEDPVGFLAIIANEALNDFEKHPGKKEKRVLIELSKLDMTIKTTSLSPWSLLSAFLLQMA